MVRCGDVRSGNEVSLSHAHSRSLSHTHTPLSLNLSISLSLSQDLETWIKMLTEHLEGGEERGETLSVSKEVEVLEALVLLLPSIPNPKP